MMVGFPQRGKNAAVIDAVRSSRPGDNRFGKGRKTQVDIVPIVEHHALEGYPGVGFQSAAFGLHPDTQISVDLTAPQEPPEDQRLSETFGPPKPMPGRDCHNPGNGARSRQEKLLGIFIRVVVERTGIDQDGLDGSKAETPQPKGYQGQCQEGLEEQPAL
jgi:hypothetical protein